MSRMLRSLVALLILGCCTGPADADVLELTLERLADAWAAYTNDTTAARAAPAVVV